MTDIPTHLLDSVRVGDCMRAGIFSCDPDTPARELAATMASLRIHALALRAAPAEAPALVSDLDLIAAIAGGDDRVARDMVGGAAVTISRTQPMRAAAKLMSEHRAAHIVVVDEANGHPVGVLSTTDILQAYGAARSANPKE